MKKKFFCNLSLLPPTHILVPYPSPLPNIFPRCSWGNVAFYYLMYAELLKYYYLLTILKSHQSCLLRDLFVDVSIQSLFALSILHINKVLKELRVSLYRKNCPLLPGLNLSFCTFRFRIIHKFYLGQVG